MNLILPVKHIKQQFNWDCGVTCLRMLIDYYHLDSSLFDRLLDSYECNQSTWTIDLLHLLHQSGIDAILHTITIGCSSSYDNVPYYETLIRKDRERVDTLFLSEASNIKIGSIEWSDLKSHLIEQRTPCLVLVDADKLQCCTCKKTTLTRIFDRLISTISSTYQGHYILVIGYTASDNKEFVSYTDPGQIDGFCTTTRENFDLARKAFGTDEDIILCYKRDRN
ncbi:unnamed protein product [Rotaria magnacalcarata]|uniref:Guanylyl cyclase n=1 Tax=Rotaria magnacalcarata TaxID=392030 RepID=A0A816WKN7_9BILA|nr:unnamed protein product [Rotaria magnacalcarata]CAF3857658.1 unnamed protein product [Rotaria magnacalcarata]